MTQLRPLIEADYSFIDSHVVQRTWERADKQWVSLINPDCIGSVLKNKHPDIHSVIVNETYLLVFSVAQLWFSEKTLIEEKFVYRLLDGPGKFSDVTDALEHIAQATGAVGILVGTALVPRDEVLVRMYQRAGFEVSQVGLFKNTPTPDDIM